MWVQISFQSTRPMRGATDEISRRDEWAAFQSTRPMRGATFFSLYLLHSLLFQSTRPVWGATSIISASSTFASFQSTRPVWGATRVAGCSDSDKKVSIHAPHAGRDVCSINFRRCPIGFNPRAPCGARQWRSLLTYSHSSFNPRAPCGARRQSRRTIQGRQVSIHAPHAGRDGARHHAVSL